MKKFQYMKQWLKRVREHALLQMGLRSVEVERGLLRNNGLTFPLIKNEYIYTQNLKHKNRKQSTQNTKNKKQS